MKVGACDRCQCWGKRGRRNLICCLPLLPAAIVSCANVEISENKKRRVLQCQYWRQSAQSNKTGKLREGRQNGEGDLKTHSFVSSGNLICDQNCAQSESKPLNIHSIFIISAGPL